MDFNIDWLGLKGAFTVDEAATERLERFGQTILKIIEEVATGFREPENSHVPWTEIEENNFKDEVREDKIFEDIARDHKRSMHDLVQKLEEIVEAMMEDQPIKKVLEEFNNSKVVKTMIWKIMEK